MKKSIFTVCFIFLLTSLTTAQDSNIKEITKNDITLYKKLKSEEISVFGIHLGMSPDEVHFLLMKNKNLDYQVDKMHRTTDVRIYVYDKDETGKNKNCILYLIWEDRSPKLNLITFFEDFAPYLLGNSTKLLTPEVLNKKSDISADFLGQPDKSEITLNIPSIQMKHTSYFYESAGFRVTLKKSSDKTSVVFAIFNIE